MGGLSAGVAAAASPRVAVGSVPRLPDAARVIGSVSRSDRVALTLSLTSRAPLAMQSMATEVSTPGSPVYRHYLTVAQFAARFGAPDAHIAAVTRVLRAEGLHVGSVDADRLSLDVTGTAAQLQRAFATRLARVRLSTGRSAYADRRTPTLPASIAGDVDAVVGLNTLVAPQSDQVVPGTRLRGDFAAPRSTSHVATGGPQPCAGLLALQASGSMQYAGYTADAIQAAYNFSGLYAQGDVGAGQTIALYELESLSPADVAAYQACYGTTVRFSYVHVDHPKATPTDEEAALDADQLISLAPGAKVIVYQAPDTAAGSLANFSRIVSQDRARTVSTSWGGCEARLTLDHSDLSLVRAESKLFEEAALQGQSILSATGDSGSAGCFGSGGGGGQSRLAVQDPSSQPFATGVGGTTLYTVVNGKNSLWDPNVAGEPAPLQAVWNDGTVPDPSTGRTQAAATSGGLSSVWAMPGYQSRANRGLGVINAHSSGRPCHSKRCREVPDVSANGDPATGYLVYTTGPDATGANTPQWSVEGGTSAAAPLWAALTALTNALPSCRGAALGFENPSLYTLAARPGNLTDVSAPNPVTRAANNDAIGKNGGLFPVTAGYDMTTGLGTPDAAQIAAGLCGLRAPVYTVAVARPKVRMATVHTTFRLRVHGTDSGRLPLRYTARGLPRGLKISRKGVIAGKPRRLGSYRVTVSATDHATNTGTVRFPIKVVTPPPTVTKVALTGVSRRRPALAFTVTKGDYAPQLRSVTVRLPRGLTFGRRGRGIHLSAGRHRVRFHFTRRHGALTITFRSVQRQVRVTIAHPTLFASAKIATTARHHHAAKVRIRLSATDKHRRTSRFTVHLRFKK